MDVRIRQPRDDGGNAAAERDQFDLQEDATVFFLTAPVHIQPPKQSAIVTDWQFMFCGLAHVSQFGNTGRAEPPVPVARIHANVAIVKIHIVEDGRPRFAEHTQLHLEVVLLLTQHFGPLHTETENLRIARIVLHQGHRLLQCGARNENRPYPVMQQAVGYPDRPVVIARFQAFRYNLAAR